MITELEKLKADIDAVRLNPEAIELEKTLMLDSASHELLRLISKQQEADRLAMEQIVYLNFATAKISPFLIENSPNGEDYTIGVNKAVAQKIHAHKDPAKALKQALDNCGWNDPELEDVPEPVFFAA